RRIGVVDRLEDVDAADFRHAQIDDRDVSLQGFQLGEDRLAARPPDDLKALVAAKALDNLNHARFVIDDEKHGTDLRHVDDRMRLSISGSRARAAKPADRISCTSACLRSDGGVSASSRSQKLTMIAR